MSDGRADVFVVGNELETLMEPATWRLVVETMPRSDCSERGRRPGDCRKCAAGDSPPTVRFYAWRPPAVSLGRLQPSPTSTRRPCSDWATDRAAADGRKRHPAPMVHLLGGGGRRPRARRRDGCHLRINSALLAGLRRLGVATDEAPGTMRRPRRFQPSASRVPSAYGSPPTRRSSWAVRRAGVPVTCSSMATCRSWATLRGSSTCWRSTPDRYPPARRAETRACTLAQALAMPTTASRSRSGQWRRRLQARLWRGAAADACARPADARRSAPLGGSDPHPLAAISWNRQK